MKVKEACIKACPDLSGAKSITNTFRRAKERKSEVHQKLPAKS
jgi:hypothetical protein